MEDVLVKVRKFIFPVDFVILDFENDEEGPLILGMPFMYIAKAILDVYEGTLILRVGEESCKFNMYQGMKNPSDFDNYMRVDVIDDCVNEVQRWRLAKSCELEDIKKCLHVNSHESDKYFEQKELFIHHALPKDIEPTPPSIVKPPSLALKPLP